MRQYSIECCRIIFVALQNRPWNQSDSLTAPAKKMKGQLARMAKREGRNGLFNFYFTHATRALNSSSGHTDFFVFARIEGTRIPIPPLVKIMIGELEEKELISNLQRLPLTFQGGRG
jgi:hypothetical protein